MESGVVGVASASEVQGGREEGGGRVGGRWTGIPREPDALKPQIQEPPAG